MSAVLIDLNDVQPPRAGRAAHYDLDLVVQRLRETAEAWVPKLFPNGRRLGDEWRLANIGGAEPRSYGSCVISLKGPHAGDWHDFDGDQGGGPINTLAHATGLDGAALIGAAADMTGVLAGMPEWRAPATTPSLPKRDAAQEMAHIQSGLLPIAGTPAARYLAGRGLIMPVGADLRYHPDLTHWEAKAGFAAMVGLIRDRSGTISGLHRTWLEERAGGAVTKASVPKSRMMLGKVAGGAVRLASFAGEGALGISEGIETGLAVMTACPGLPVWATLSTSGLEQVQLPPAARRVIILADNDASGAGLRAAETAARRLRMEGREAVIALPPMAGQDFNDLLTASGADAVKAAIMRALPKEEDAAPEIGQHRPLNYVTEPDDLPVLRADEGDLARAVERVWSLLLASNRTPWLFRYAGQPTWVVPDDEGRPVAAALNEDRLRHMLARLAAWVRQNAKGEMVPAPPPLAVVKSVLATPDPGLPVLMGIVNTPVFGRNGKLLTSPGYHPDARLLYQPAPGFAVPAVPERPTSKQIAEARALICEDLLGDFPFVSPSEMAHGVALLLLGFLRSMINGPTPLHLIEKPTPGTGATLMVDSIATILTGSGASVMTEGRDDEEWRKRVTAKLRQVPSILLIDNLRNKLDSSAVAAALTAPFWEDRILGASEMARLPIRCVWIATGNNPEFSNEMARRLIRIRLDAHVERPWQRGSFRHPDLMIWVRANRAQLVAACLTLCQAWIAAGRPRGTKTIGSYENWAGTIGGILETAGIEGFLGNLDEMMASSDTEGSAWAAFVTGWWHRYGTAEVKSADLYELALMAEPPLPLGNGNDHSRRIRLGKSLARMRDRVFKVGVHDLRLAALGISHQAQQWSLRMAGECGECFPEPNPAVSGECCEVAGSVPTQHSPLQPIDPQGSGECGEFWECFSTPTRAHARAYEEKGTQKHSPNSPHSPGLTKSEASPGESGGECEAAHSPMFPDRKAVPAWLREVTDE
ncbi:toprim domain-containing protein [Aestuariivirga sp.]|uniref:DUF7146 domain-containing protein n=1 Tax=Aestuariivirga sp. TaxID=2650926 RepID=UPI00391CFE48